MLSRWEWDSRFIIDRKEKRKTKKSLFIVILKNKRINAIKGTYEKRT
jgi:hypothetical protein